jgi:hypothetical protein
MISTARSTYPAILKLITPYIRMLDSDWLLAVIFFLQIQAFHCEFAEFLHHVLYVMGNKIIM